MNLANYSESGLIVCALAVSMGKIDSQWLVIIAIVLSVSLIVASPLNKHADRIFELIRSRLKRWESNLQSFSITRKWKPSAMSEWTSP